MTADEFSQLQAILNRQEFTEALEYLTFLDRKEPNRSAVQYHLGYVNRQLGNFGEAVLRYEEAIRLDPFTPTFYLGLGIALQHQGNLEAALRSVQRAIDLQPDYVNAWNTLGMTHKISGNLQLALTAYRRAQELLVSIANTKVRQRWPDAIETRILESGEKGTLVNGKYFVELKRTLQVDLLYATLMNNIGGCYLDLGCHDEAKAAFQESIEFIPDGATYEPPYMGLRRIEEVT
jgi:tetratricopeptide (TPR) repeat protein